MSMDTDIFDRNGGGVVDEKDEKARRAVKVFRALQPTLTSYARILTKRTDLRVEMSATSNGSTDNKRIFFRPPLALGDNTPHDRRLCDKRDDQLQPLCAACKVREGVLVAIYHEIAHICYDSFAPPEQSDFKRMLETALAMHGSKYADAVQKKIDAAPYDQKRSFKGLAELISPFLPILVNGLEDARVNRSLFQARKGTQIMFEANDHSLFIEGVEQVNPQTGKTEKVMWNTYPVNAQVIIGVFCKASGYDYSEYFVPEVIVALDDEKLTSLVRTIDTTRTASGVYHLSFPVLARLRELGFCKDPSDPEPEPEPEPEENEEQESEPQQADEQGDADPDEEEDEDEGDGEAGGDSEAKPQFDSTEGSGSSDEQREGGDDESEDPGEEGSAAADSDTDSVQSDESDEGEGSSDPSGGSGEDEQVDPDGGGGSEEEADDDARVPEGDGDPTDVPEEGPVGGDDRSESDGGGSPDEDGEPDDGGTDSSGGGEDHADSSEASGASEQDADQHSDDDSDARADESSDPQEGNSTEQSDAGREDLNETSQGSGSHESEAESAEEGSDHGDPDDTASGTPDESEPPEVEDPDGPEPESDEAPDDHSEELIDTGADDGTGGVEIIENENKSDLPSGEPEEVRAALLKWLDHDEKPTSIKEAQAEEDALVDRAIIQGIYFETPSSKIHGVREHTFGDPIFADGINISGAWDRARHNFWGGRQASGVDGDFDPSERIIGPALMRMRVAFSDNQRGHEQRHLKSGKVNAKVLGKRAIHHDERLFKRRILPGKKNYFVLIGMDLSGSTLGTNLQLEKKAVMAQAELLSRMGIKFAVYGHSGSLHAPRSRRAGGFDLDMYLIKKPDEPWNTETQARLKELGPDAANLDGHTLEYYRKVLDKVDATDKIILYYTDGKMPAENHDEELEILQREIKICKKKGYTLLGVGIRTDSPVRHGLDTVQVDEQADVIKVIKHIEKRLLSR